MIAFKAHYDGKVIVPDEPVDLQPNQELRVRVDAVETPSSAAKSFGEAIGVGLPLPENHVPRFNSNDDLWDKTK